MVRGTTAHHAFRRLTTRQLLFLARIRLHTGFNTSANNDNRPVTSELQTTSRKTQTRKCVATLPQRLILSDGSSVAPLPSWDGGLANPRLKSLAKPVDTSPEACMLSVGTASIKRASVREENPRRPRGRPRKSQKASKDPKHDSPKDAGAAEDMRYSAALNDIPTDPITKLESSEPGREPRNQLAKEILENLSNFPHCILLTRVGQFYESYFDQAQEVSRLLSIKLTKRTWDGQRIRMCGFPLMHLDKHLKTLVQQHNRSVAMCEEFQRPRDPSTPINSKPSFERRVVRVLTPGTLIDEPFLNPYENNFLLALSVVGEEKTVVGNPYTSQPIGLAWIDVSTGEFFTKRSTIQGLNDDMARINPREIVIDSSLKSAASHPLRSILLEEKWLVSYATIFDESFNEGSTISAEVCNDILKANLAETPSDIFSMEETMAITLLTSFLRANLLENTPQNLHPTHEGLSKRMQIDAHTLKALEIRECIREGGTNGSLMGAIKRTVTGGGTRLLARWLCSPSTSLEEIKARQDLVDLFCTRPALREDIVELLKGVEDASRITQKFLLGKGNVEDLNSIQHTIEIWDAVGKRITLEKSLELGEDKEKAQKGAWQSMDLLVARMSGLHNLVKRISQAVDTKDTRKQSLDPEHVGDESIQDLESNPNTLPVRTYTLPGDDVKWTIKPQFTEELASLHVRFQQLQSDREQLQTTYQQLYDAPSLTLRHSPGYGMHVHVAKRRCDLERLKRSRQFVKVAETNSTKTFFNQEWFVLGNSLIEKAMAINAAEKNAFMTLRNEVNAMAGAIRRNARIIDELDVTSAFATLASELQFVKPLVTAGNDFYIENGRHPTVELGLLQNGRMFTSNSVSMSDSSRLHIITGPNMAGKSTFLRQMALIAILAQTGSFVPADNARIGLVDKVFSRVGAKDDLFRERSTFMVEMLETAEILRNATEKSLVIMDEVGRGTTVKDGLAIAFATIYHLYYVNQSRAFFATHFHELVDMLGYSDNNMRATIFPAIDFFCTDVDETKDGHFAYSHHMRAGVNRDSHGLKVAQIAGMPPLATRMATKALNLLVSSHESFVGGQEKLRKTGRALAKF